MSYSKSNEDEAELALLSDSLSTTSDDLESNRKDEVTSSTEPEYQTPISVKFTWLGSYFLFSMLLTLYNKLLLGSFKFPWLLTCMHTTFASLGTLVLLKLGRFKLSRLTPREHLALVAFSVLFTANIAMSNLSLSLVSLAFFQIIRNTVPIFTVLIYRIWFGRLYSMETYLSLCPIIIGAGMTVVGEYHYSALGLFITVFGVILAAVKTVTTNRLMTGSLALPSMELLFRMSPLAAVQSFMLAVIVGELPAFADSMSQRAAESSRLATVGTVVFLLGNGLLAFFLNVSSFQTNKLAGALTISVCGNLKQAVTLAIGIFVFKDFTVDIINGIGILLVLAGCAFFSKAELDSKRTSIS
ncbi:Drug/metabolite transporter [Penicillium cf. griseofulvum]|uniref:Drug/metabolite transporter n=1 Tax=Penicillium cf. griseofulvum TaxID=2972120 RepID=A0A9W9M952_9EURO|nr:Drug/metabolite transporter [Penicillium cf. griseofulvum]KAJ5445118.1 Drug/metabolite transporter [Penicillium cf. griseofulvum]